MKADIEAYLDNILDPEPKARFEAELERDAELRQALADARRVREDLSWLAVEKGVLPGEQAYWENKRKRMYRYRWFWLVPALLISLGVIWWQWKKTPPPAPALQQRQPDSQTPLPGAPSAPVRPEPGTVESPGAQKKQAGNVVSGSRLFAENFQPYKDDSLEPARRSAGEPSPSERFQQLYWEDKHHEALLAFDQLVPADKNNDNFLFLKANCLLATGRTAEAATLLEKIIRNDSTRFMAEAQWYLALSYLKSGQAEEARTLLRNIQADPASARQSDAKRLLEQWK